MVAYLGSDIVINIVCIIFYFERQPSCFVNFPDTLGRLYRSYYACIQTVNADGTNQHPFVLNDYYPSMSFYAVAYVW